MFDSSRNALMVFLLALSLAAAVPEAAAQTFEATWESLGQYRCPDWFRDAKLGIFLHWGPTSVPAVDGWYGRNMYIQGHRAYEYHVKTFGHPSKFGYKDIIPLWKAEKFDPDHLVRVFKQAGAGYVVPVAVHHDNFDLWDSKHQRWNSVKMGPKKDIIGLWRKAVLANGLRFGVSSHMDRSISWFNPSKSSDKTGTLAGIPYDGADPSIADLYGGKNEEAMDWPYLPKNAPASWRQTWLLRTRDLIDTYQPDLLYFDGGIPYVDVGLGLVAHFYNANQKWNNGRLEAVLNLKKTKVSGAYQEGMCVQDLERSKLEGIKPEPWQTDTSINGPWFYERGGRYITPNDVMDMFVDIVSKNGNLLLNIPLMADGTLDAESKMILTEMGKWMEVNKEAIHGTRPWLTYGEGPTSVKNEYSEKIKEAFTSQDFRFTTKDGAVYAIGLDWPAEGRTILVRSLAAGQAPDKIGSVRLLGFADSLKWERVQEGLKVELPEKKPCEYAYALKIARDE
jgi:alpha-L-fucosidase